MVAPVGRKLKDAVDNLATNSRTCSEDGGVAQLLAKLLAVLLHLAGLLGALRAVGAVADVEGHVAVVGGGRSGGVGGHEGLVLLAHVAGGEDALHAGALVAALPPLRVHVLGNDDAVVGHEGKVAGVLGMVLVHGGGVGEHGGARGRRRHRGVGRRRRVGGRVGVVAHVGCLLLGRRRLAPDTHVRQLLRRHRDGHRCCARGRQRARAVLSRHGQLRRNRIVLCRGEHVGLDEELQVLQAPRPLAMVTPAHAATRR